MLYILYMSSLIYLPIKLYAWYIPYMKCIYLLLSLYTIYYVNIPYLAIDHKHSLLAS